MKIIDIIPPLKDRGSAEKFIQKELPELDFDMIEIYMIGTLDLESEIRFFNAEEIPNKISIEIDGIKYVNLFPLCLAQEMVESYAQSQEVKYSDVEIAEQLLNYRITDA